MDGEDSNRGSAALHPLKMQLLNNVWVNQPKICLDLLQTCVTSQQFYRN